MTARGLLAALLAAGLAFAPGCAARRPRAPLAPAPDASNALGVYRGQAWDEAGHRMKFRLLLHARPPDRIHAEVIPPVGGPSWILDAGDGRVSLTVVSEATAYVGEGRAQVVGHLLGVGIAPADLVRALLGGEAPGVGLTVVRTPEEGQGLPETFELREGARGFRLDRSELRATATQGLGTGRPPSGLKQVPIEDFGVGPAYE